MMSSEKKSAGPTSLHAASMAAVRSDRSGLLVIPANPEILSSVLPGDSSILSPVIPAEAAILSSVIPAEAGI